MNKMKNILAGVCSVLMFSMALPAEAENWTLQGNNIYNNNAGNVGIGVTSPTAALEIGQGLGIKLTASAGFGVTLKSNDYILGLDGLSIRNKADTAYAAFAASGFYAAYSTVGNSGGYMNNDFTSYRTAVNVNDAGTIVTASTGQYGWNSSSGFNYLAQVNDTGLARNAAGVIKVTDGSTGWGSILAGQVGIGTTTPTQALDVNGNIKLSGSVVSDGDICIGTCP